MKLKLGKKLKRPASLLIALLLAASGVVGLPVNAQTSVNAADESIEGTIAPLSEEYLEYLENGGESDSGLIPSSLDLSYLSEEAEDYESEIDLPSSYDLRDYGRVGAMKDQGRYGLCWAFSILGSIESTMIEQFPDINLSVRYLAWSTLTGDVQEEFYGNSDDYMNDGSLEINGIGVLSSWGGLAYTSDYPYNLDYEIDESDRYVSEYHVQDAYVVRHYPNIRTYSDVSSGSMQMIKEMIMEYGAVSFNYNAGTTSREPDYNSETNAFYNPDEVAGNHAVLVVGWDDNYSRENFYEGQQPDSDGAWLIKNSWGDQYLDDGYMWVSYETPSISVDEIAFVEDSDNYKTNYQYDLSWMISAAADNFVDESKASRTAYISGIYTAESDEVLEAVSFYTTDFNAEYEISVYTGVNENEPTSGTLAYSGQTGTEKYAGYHTIELNQAVALNKGECFSVVVKLTNPEYAYPIAADTCEKKSDSTVKSGETFYSKDGSSWNDIININSHNVNVNGADDTYIVADICIKAFTNPLPESGEAIANVDFSILEGSVALGSELELSNSESIHYQLSYEDGTQSEVMAYTEPIVLSKACTVTAWGERDGKEGNRVSKTYTEAQSKLIDLYYTDTDGNHTSIDISNENAENNVYLSNEKDKIAFRARGADTITIDGTEVQSDEWSDYIDIPEGGKRTISITTSADGKTSTTYTVNVYRSCLIYDYKNETASFDETKYSIADEDGNEFKSGDSLTPYIAAPTEDNYCLYATDLSSGEIIKLTIPKRPAFSSSAETIDYIYETTSFTYPKGTVYSYNSDMSDAVMLEEKDYIPIIPGKNVYIQKSVGENSFRCEAFEIVVPEKPDAPSDISVETSKTTATIIINGDESITADYYNPEYEESDEFITGNTITGLEPGKEYTYCIAISATDDAFSSNFVQVSFKTKSDSEAVDINVSYRAYGEEIFCKTYTLGIGENIIEADTEAIAEKHLVLSEGEDAAKTVNVFLADGIATADTETVVFNLDIGSPIESYTYTVQYWDCETGEYISESTYAFESISELHGEDIPVLDGYEYVRIDGRSLVDKSFATQLFYADGLGEWIVLVDPVYMVVQKTSTEEPSEDSSDEPSESSTEPSESSTEPSESSTEPSESSTEPNTSEPSVNSESSTDTVNSTDNGTSDAISTGKAVSTGDSSSAVFIAVIFAGAALTAIILSKRKKIQK